MIPADGVVLAGGRSSRMGRPKSALAAEDGATLEQRAERVLASVCQGPVWISRPHGSAAPSPYHVVDESPDIGPLEGLRVGLSHSTHDLLAVLAVDLPAVVPALYEDLYRAWCENPGTDVVFAKSATGESQPLAALWHVRMLTVVDAALRSETRRVLTVAESAQTQAITVDPAILVNINPPSDWQQWSGEVLP